MRKSKTGKKAKLPKAPCRDGTGLESGLYGGLDRSRWEKNPGGRREVNDSTHRSREGGKTGAKTENRNRQVPAIGIK